MTHVLKYDTANGKMGKLAAARALAEFAYQPVPHAVLKAYNLHQLAHGNNWFIPKPLKKRVFTKPPSVFMQAATIHRESRLLMDETEYRIRLQSEVAEF